MTGSQFDAGTVLRALGTGTRVVVRHRIAADVTGAHFTDALGVLLTVDSTHCTIDTRRGVVVVALTSVVAAKAVPPPPVPRGSRKRGRDAQPPG